MSAEDFPLTKTPLVESGTTSGYQWVVARAPIYGAANGYVRLPDTHPWLAVEYGYEIENSVPWGEITFMSGNWVGFDTMHAEQTWPEMRRSERDTDFLMDDETVIEWAKQLADEASNVIFNGAHQI